MLGEACCVELQEVSPRPGRTTVALGLRACLGPVIPFVRRRIEPIVTDPRVAAAPAPGVSPERAARSEGVDSRRRRLGAQAGACGPGRPLSGAPAGGGATSASTRSARRA